MKKVLITIMISLQIFLLFAFKNWKIYTNQTHIYKSQTIGSELYCASWGGVVVFDKSTGEVKKKFTKLEGLNDNEINSLDYQELSKYVLMGTENGGVNVYDGNAFKIPITETLGLLSNRVNYITHKDSLIYIATSQGLSVFQISSHFPIPILIDNYNDEDGLTDRDISKIVIHNNIMYAITAQGVDYVSTDSLYLVSAWHHFSNSQTHGNAIQDLVVKRKRIYLATNFGIMNYDLNFKDLIPYTTANGLKSNFVNVIAVDDDGNIYFSYGFWEKEELIIKNSLSNYPLGKISSTGKIDYFNKSKNSVLSDRIKSMDYIDGELIISTWGKGTDIYKNDLWKHYEKNTIGTNTVTKMTIDKEHNLWICDGHLGSGNAPRGTMGVSKFDGENWVSYNTANSNLNSDNIFRIATGNDGRVWFGAWDEPIDSEYDWQRGITIFDQGEIEPFVDQNNLINKTISFLENDTQGRMWIGSYPGGINIVENNEVIDTFTFPTSHDQGPDPLCAAISSTKAYIGTYESGLRIGTLAKFHNAGKYPWTQPIILDLQKKQIYDLALGKDYDGNDMLWVASPNGLFMYTKNIWYKYDVDYKRKKYSGHSWQNEILYYVDEPRLYGSNDGFPTALYVDPFNRVWIGTRDFGISVYDIYDESYTILTSENSPLLSNNITSFAYDSHSGNMYIGSDRGLNSVNIGIDSKPNSLKIDSVIAYPNPFNPNITQTLRIENENSIFPKGKNICRIYDLNGDLVIKLNETILGDFAWNGKNSNNRNCGNGMYFYVVSAGKKIYKGKIALIRK